jgi:hypothetical protein
MKKLILFSIVACLLMTACDKEDDSPAIPKAKILEGSWYIHSIINDDVCGSAVDDAWTFDSNGTYEFDHGTVTEAGNCGDFVNHVGTWEFTDSETKLKIVAEHETDNPSNVFNRMIFHAKLEALTNEKLVIVIDDPDADITIEFRRR